jgi:hypothetical protein
MVSRFILAAALAMALGFTASQATADGEKERVFEDRGRAETSGREFRVSRRKPVRMHYRAASHHYHGYRHHYWDGRYGLYPRRHFFVSGIHAHGYYGSPVNYATVTYRTYIYYTPHYPSVSYGYPPYAELYNLTPGPIYNKPCLC